MSAPTPHTPSTEVDVVEAIVPMMPLVLPIVEAIVPMMPLVLPIVGGVLMLLLAFIAVSMA